MTKPLSATNVLDRTFLEIRCRLLDIAAALDRIERAEDGTAIRHDDRMKQIQQSVKILIDGDPERARRVQMVFSDAYDPGWR